MNNGCNRAAFSIHVTLALVSGVLLALDTVKAEAALTTFRRKIRVEFCAGK